MQTKMSMAVMYWAILVALLASGAVSSTSPTVDTVNVNEEKVGNWSVGDCILAKFAMNFTIYPEGGNGSTITLPPSAIADKDDKGSLCTSDVKKVQTLSLSWKEKQKNDTSILLNRFVQIQFMRMENSSFYGVYRFWGKFDVANYKENVTDPSTNKTVVEAHNSTLTFDSKEVSKLMFHTPNDKSYQCADVGKISLISSMQWNYTKMASHDVSNTTANALQVQFDAFRNIKALANVIPDQFRVSIDCDYQPNDIVPIAVGVALAALVVAVLIAYMVGRRRNRHAGYQSV